MQKTEWFKRKFPVIEDNGILPSIIERLSGTPARVEEIISKLEPARLTWKPKEKWTIQEEVGHLSDLEPTTILHVFVKLYSNAGKAAILQILQ